MKTRYTPTALLCAALCILAVACSEPSHDEGAETGVAAGPAGPGTDTGDPASGDLPPGHPTVSSPAAESLILPPPTGSGAGAAGLTWTVPAGWVEEAPASAMRRAQYRVPGPAGDGECVVFYFGPGQGGDAMANAQRWANQFSQPDGSSPLEALETERIRVGDIPVLLAEITGTYSGGMTMMGGPSAELADHMLLGAIAEGGDANWFFKLTGPAATLETQTDAFRGMIDSLSRGG